MAGQEESPTRIAPAGLPEEAPEYVQKPPRLGKLYQSPIIGGLGRFFSWWLVFFGIYASSSVCPCCGTPGCPVGVGAAGIIGGCFAALWTYGRAGLDRLKALIERFGRFKRGHHVTGPD
ncbi:MAG: hypothetical protein M0P73_12970 [Syntrophobacterales bacterium]|jgi:hypothetical protein|nr:hypothetical protein [Syntrophobacterales bacterium]